MGNIYKMDKRLKNVIENIIESSYSDEEVKEIIEFKRHLEAEGLKKITIKRYLYSLLTLAPYINDLLDPSERELKKLVGEINKNELNSKLYSVWTLNEFKKGLKKFYSYYYGGSDPEILDFMKTHVREAEKPLTTPDELPSLDDVRRLVRTESKSRNSALLFFTYESGARIGEVLEIKWKDISFTEYGAKVKFRKSKSMKRQIPLYESVEHLRSFKEVTPKPNESDYVWVNTGQGSGKYYGNQMSYQGARKIFKRAGKRINADFKTNPHAFRKARATHLASKGMNAAQLCEYFGWNDFKTAKTYIRMAQKDLESAMQKIHGIEDKQEEKELQDLNPIKCPNCNTVNPATRDYCRECGKLISKEKELLKEVKKEEAEKEVKEELLKDVFNEFGISEKQLEDKIKDKTKSKLEETLN